MFPLYLTLLWVVSLVCRGSGRKQRAGRRRAKQLSSGTDAELPTGTLSSLRPQQHGPGHLRVYKRGGSMTALRTVYAVTVKAKEDTVISCLSEQTVTSLQPSGGTKTPKRDKRDPHPLARALLSTRPQQETL